MNKVIETIFERRSIRTFEPRAIETERVAEILECGRRAPNAWGHQSFELFAITDPLLMDELAALTAKYLGGKVEEHRFFSAPLIVLISDLRENFMRLADAGCIMEPPKVTVLALSGSTSSPPSPTSWKSWTSWRASASPRTGW